MKINIGIPKEITSGERRVAATPETVAKMLAAEFSVFIESHAGLASYNLDEDYVRAGAEIKATAKELYEQSHVILKVQAPSLDEIDFINENAVLITPLTQSTELINKIKTKKINVFALNLLPRIARAQSMDILSSMSNIAGYKSVILAAHHLTKFFPMLTTAAGTILPAKVIVIGAGVAGLQAIATARRLGAVVIACDTRPATEEQVKSLGASFVSLATSHEQSEDKSGYAKEQSADFYKHEQNIISPYMKDADVIITTALIPGKRAPLLITEQMVKEMKPGSVIVDLAIEQQGNCALSELDKIVVLHHVTIIGLSNLPSMMPVHASQLYAKNIWSFLNYIAAQLQSGTYDKSDEIVKSCMV